MELIYQAAGYALMTYERNYARHWIIVGHKRVAEAKTVMARNIHLDQLHHDIEIVVRASKVYA